MVNEDPGGVVAELRARHGRSTQPESSAVMAVLQAVLDVLAAEAMAPSPTAIFAACMSSLESSPDTRKDPQVRTGARVEEGEGERARPVRGRQSAKRSKTPCRGLYLGDAGRGDLSTEYGHALP